MYLNNTPMKDTKYIKFEKVDSRQWNVNVDFCEAFTGDGIRLRVSKDKYYDDKYNITDSGYIACEIQENDLNFDLKNNEQVKDICHILGIRIDNKLGLLMYTNYAGIEDSIIKMALSVCLISLLSMRRKI